MTRRDLLKKLLGTGLTLVLFAAAAVLSRMLFDAWAEHREYAEREAQERAAMEDAQAELEARRRYLNALEDDPAVRERAVREHLRYTREGEILVLYDDEWPDAPDRPAAPPHER